MTIRDRSRRRVPDDSAIHPRALAIDPTRKDITMIDHFESLAASSRRRRHAEDAHAAAAVRHAMSRAVTAQPGGSVSSTPPRATATASPASPPALRAVAPPPQPRHILTASEQAEDQAEASALWRRARAANRRSK